MFKDSNAFYSYFSVEASRVKEIFCDVYYIFRRSFFGLYALSFLEEKLLVSFPLFGL